MPASYSKLVIQNVTRLVPSKYMQRLNLELKRTFIILVSLLKTHRRKAFLLSLGPATIIKIATVMLPIMKILPPTIKAIQSLSYFTKKKDSARSTRGVGGSSIPGAIVPGAGADGGVGMTMDELFEIVWTPAEDVYWERVNAMVTRSGLCKTLGVSLGIIEPGHVEVIMPFRAEVSGEGDVFHASLLPMLIAMTSQLTGMTLLPRHFSLQPIDFKCNILSDCDVSTFMLVARGAVVVRGEHSITAKVEVLKTSEQMRGRDGSIIGSGGRRQKSKSWFSRGNSRQRSNDNNNNQENDGRGLIPGTGLDRSQFVLCATGMQTNVIVRAGTDITDEEAKEIQRWREERRRMTASSTPSKSDGASTRSSLSITTTPAPVQSPSLVDAQDHSILLGDTLLSPVSASPTSDHRPSNLYPPLPSATVDGWAAN
ncbi:hypothetical protein BGW42_004668 [Actinomortierella wolfii]|nr:hypothetical protein BGW42_004668 [Actinomortierella wolfii]